MDDYNKLEKDNITNNYEKCNDKPLNNINLEAINFLTHPKFCLINPTKSDVGRNYKIEIDYINEVVRSKSKVMS